MRILFTGASSHSGYWFVQELVRQGHEVCALFTKPLALYERIRKERIERLLPHVEAVFDCAFGSSLCLEVIEGGNKWDLFCHHAAEVRDYKSADFNVIKACANNTNNLPSVLEKLANKGCARVILTGTYFEPDEGFSSGDRGAFSPYGLSKGLTSQIFHFYTARANISLGKFVMPNPLGPYEEGRFTTYLATQWLQGKVPEVQKPRYIRDNMPVDLMAKVYAHFCDHSSSSYCPSGWVESVAHFTERFAKEIGKRFPCACPYVLKEQTTFEEPHICINSTPVDGVFFGWQEESFWDQLAEYYLKFSVVTV